MRYGILFGLLAVFGLTAHVQPERNVLLLRNVTVIAADGTPPRSGMNVLVRGERIAALGPASELPAPPGAQTVDGTGRFLIPGLIDLHSHMSKARASAFGLFVANGVTTIRDMGGDLRELLAWRRQIDEGTRIGPRMLIAGPYLEAARNITRMRKDPPESRVEPFENTRIGVGSPEEARAVVSRLSTQAVDFLKIRTVENRETYLALNAAARAHGLRLVGHVSGLTPETVLEAGQAGIDHTFYEPTKGTREQRLELWRQFAKRGVPIVPTLVTLFEATLPPIDQLRAMVADDKGTTDPRRAYVSRYTVLDWREQLEEANPERTQLLLKLWEQDIRRELREMHEAGMEVLAGSDVAVLNIFPGDALHRELALFTRELGLTPTEAIERATWRSARFLGIGDSTGTVARGKVADLVLLDADPTVDIANTRKIAAVFLRGKMFDARGIARLLEDVKNAPDIREDDWGRTRRRR